MSKTDFDRAADQIRCLIGPGLNPTGLDVLKGCPYCDRAADTFIMDGGSHLTLAKQLLPFPKAPDSLPSSKGVGYYRVWSLSDQPAAANQAVNQLPGQY